MVLNKFDIEFVKLKIGKHHIKYDIYPDFFKDFENGKTDKCEGKVDLFIEKVNETFYILEFKLKGVFELECDRCLNNFKYTFSNKHIMELKVEKIKENNDDENLIIVGTDDKIINVSGYINEFFLIQLPMKATCELAGIECDKMMLGLIDRFGKNDENEFETDPRWNILKNLKNN